MERVGQRWSAASAGHRSLGRARAIGESRSVPPAVLQYGVASRSAESDSLEILSLLALTTPRMFDRLTVIFPSAYPGRGVLSGKMKPK